MFLSMAWSISLPFSSFVGRPIVNRYFASRVDEWRKHVEKQRQNLLSYIIFLRITPFLPNWYVNVSLARRIDNYDSLTDRKI